MQKKYVCYYKIAYGIIKYVYVYVQKYVVLHTYQWRLVSSWCQL